MQSIAPTDPKESCHEARPRSADCEIEHEKLLIGPLELPSSSSETESQFVRLMSAIIWPFDASPLRSQPQTGGEGQAGASQLKVGLRPNLVGANGSTWFPRLRFWPSWPETSLNIQLRHPRPKNSPAEPV